RSAYERSLAEYPEDNNVRTELACLMIDCGERDEGARMLRGILRTDPGATNAKVRLGRLMLAQGKFDAARELFESLVSDLPNRWEGHEGLALAKEALEELGSLPESGAWEPGDTPLQELTGVARELKFDAL